MKIIVASERKCGIIGFGGGGSWEGRGLGAESNRLRSRPRPTTERRPIGFGEPERQASDTERESSTKKGPTAEEGADSGIPET